MLILYVIIHVILQIMTVSTKGYLFCCKDIYLLFSKLDIVLVRHDTSGCKLSVNIHDFPRTLILKLVLLNRL